MKVKSVLCLSAVLSAVCASSPVFAKVVTERQVVTHYADIAHAVYADAFTAAKNLSQSVDQFLTAPSEKTMMQVKQAWLASRVPYQQSEVFRFGNSVVDDWEGQLNAWPLDEGLIDYVSSDYQYELGNEGANANIIANKTLRIGASSLDTTTITPELIASLNEIGGSEANVASGYHAIEFLLWGQDLNGTKPGAGLRPYTDYIVGSGCTHGNCTRRGEYLRAATQLLVQDLQWMEKQWSADVKNNYRQTLLADTPENGLRKMLFGMGSLSLGELAGERMKVALEANSTEDEHDCFSDNTHNSHYYDEQGIYNVYTGLYKRIDGTLISGPGIHQLVAQQDKAAAKEIQQQFDTTRSQVYQLVISAEKQNQHFDQLIAADNVQGNALVNQAISALVEQTGAIERAAGILGISNLNPDTADHEF
ncbi:imelysin family protein [Vibrio mangrovi]|uniref:Imelysin n=1 Tax=Vibrio mangrovi TaxID=474394 RepID=A0A1Y6INX4_9VIBR|nr:imelysin family protein [Vibrio mangrovi]MDW6003868.1 imelysin family protein [Vibrio mangrovi]SMR99338.1 Imelysin [Vibrio mangrovi]